MGPRQNAADAFMVASCDVGLHDRWIPDEDWVRFIRDSLEKDCSLHDMNMGLSSKLTFGNNRATVNERTVVLHNNKKVQTGKGGQKRNVHFYYVYVLAANQPVPLIATTQDFYQAIWDAPERSNRSLVRMIFVVVFSQKNLLTLRQDDPDPDVGILSQKRRFCRIRSKASLYLILRLYKIKYTARRGCRGRA